MLLCELRLGRFIGGLCLSIGVARGTITRRKFEFLSRLRFYVNS
jgi:hypothetical protein